MSNDFLPSREADLVTWLGTFQDGITSMGMAVGISTSQVTTFTGLNSTWVDAYNASQNANTRTPAGIIVKNQAKKSVVDNARLLAGIIQKFPGTSDEQRATLGLNVPAARTPIPPPSVSPFIDVMSVIGHTVQIRLHDGSLTSRAKPAGVTGANIFSYVGAAPPATVEEWTFQGGTSRNVIDIPFPIDLAPGTKVWLTAQWTNSKREAGVATDPISVLIQFGGLSQA
jgi:hypothetical protein